MSPLIAGVLSIPVMFFFMFLGMPIAAAMGFTGFLGYAYLTSFPPALHMVSTTIYGVVSDYPLTVIPLFIIMGSFAAISGLSTDTYEAAYKWLKRLPGGLALATIGGCAAFAAISGSAVATSATIGMVALPEMKKYGYDSRLTTGTVAAGGTLGFLIPPSIGFVIYSIVTEQSVGKLLIAGFLPGIILAVLFMGVVVVQVMLNPRIAPTSIEGVSWKERLLSLRKIWGIVVIFLLVMGGIYLGVFTATEAGAVGATALFVFAIGKRQLTWRNLLSSLQDTASVSCMLFLIIAGAYIFGYFLAITQIPATLATYIGMLAVSRYVVLAVIIILLLILGCIIDIGAMIVLTMPVILPTIMVLDFDPIWFGVLAVLMMNAGLITPPVGVSVYAVAGISGGVPVSDIFRGALPFLIAIIATVVILTAFPQIALFLPALMTT